MTLEQKAANSLEARIAALTENFKRWGWDPKVIEVVSK